MSADATIWPETDAPGAPGIAPTWTSSDKDLVGTGLGPSRLWFTLGRGILNEVYYPRVDIPQIRDLGFIIADDNGFWCEVKRLDNYEFRLPHSGVPAPTIVHRHPRFELTLRVVPDPQRDVLLIDVSLRGDEALRPCVLLAPHIGGSGFGNIAAVGRHYGRKVLWGEQGPFGLALAAGDREQGEAFGRMSAGYVGCSDGWQDFSANGAMKWTHQRAGPGNVAMLGELRRDCVLALGFGSSRGAAASLAVAALAQPFDQPWREQISTWQGWHAQCHGGLQLPPTEPALEDQFAISRMVLRCHMDKTYPGAMVASLSVPWGNAKDDRGGYHLVWPRDLVECATALLGVGGEAEARDVLRYLIATQYEDGHWNQNQWLGGTPFWHGIQLDETALPVILASLLHERGALDEIEVTGMTRRALGFIVRMGPATDQDRWEEDRGLNAFTLAVAVAALVAGADLLNDDEKTVALDVADDWNARLESWLFAPQTALSIEAGVRGHYIRMAPVGVLADPAVRHEVLPIRNRDQDPGLGADVQVSTDFLQLVRFGLRAPDDIHVRDSLAVIDALLRVETDSGPAWRRYNGDGYGEHEDGQGFDGTGQGRPWPLLTGERGHYELIAGNDARPFLRAMSNMAGRNGMLPEQVWDGPAMPDKQLVSGKPTGSAMPLAWTHAEFVKLMLSIQLGRACDCPQSVLDRYRGGMPQRRRAVWSEHGPVADFPVGSDLRINVSSPGLIRWRTSVDEQWRDTPVQVSLPDVYSAVLRTGGLANGDRVEFAVMAEAGAAPGATHSLIAESGLSR